LERSRNFKKNNMKQKLVILALFLVTVLHAQEQKQVPQINVTGDGKIKITPDKVRVNFGVQNFGSSASEVKKLNDETVDKVLKFIKKFEIPASDYQTTSVSLNKNYDYDKKKYNFQASQSITIILKDITKYDGLMMGLMDSGVNNISDVEFLSSKIEEYKSAARKDAMKDAKHKAEDYVSVLGQKVGKAILITDNTNVFFPQPMYNKMNEMAMDSGGNQRQETLAVGEIEVRASVTVSFVLE